LASSLAAAGSSEEAVALFQQIREADPDNPTALNNLAWLLRDLRPQQALELAERAHRLRPDVPGIQDTLGLLLLRNGVDAPRALKVLAAATEAAPQDPSIALHYAEALIENGRTTDAVPVLQGLRGQDFAGHERAAALLDELSADAVAVPGD
jgi:tetratricopeptide (TPR) repeat protein